MADGGWSGLKPSRARATAQVDGGARTARPEYDHHSPASSSFSRSGGATVEWAPSSPSYAVSDEAMSPLLQRTWGGVMAPAAQVNPPRSWNRFIAKPQGRAAAAAEHVDFITGLLRHEPSAELPVAGDILHRPGWKRSCSPTTGWGSNQRYQHFDSSPCSEIKLDAEMRVFEAQIARTVSDHFAEFSQLRQEISEESNCVSPNSVDAVEELAGVNVGAQLLKRKRSGFADSHYNYLQGDCGWIHPLKLLVRKGLTVSDVGELHRIIIPKKDAENQSFPQIDTKEGIVLEMEDYTSSKRWSFRFKYWLNNKSRMYVLENTGTVWAPLEVAGTCSELLFCGQKRMDNLDPLLDLSEGSIVKNSSSDAPSPTPEYESRRTFSCIDNLARF